VKARAPVGLAWALALSVGTAWAQPRPEAPAHEPAVEEGDADEESLRTAPAPVTAVALVSPDRAVATGRGVSLRADEVLRRVVDAPQPLLQRYASDPASLQGLVDTLVGERLLAVEARRLGLENDPIVQAATERALVARMRALHLTARGGVAADVPEAEVRAWYDAHPERFHIPERRRVRAIFATERREALETLRLATAVRQRARAGVAFRRMAAERNRDPALQALSGELRNVTREPMPGATPDPTLPPLDPALRAAVFEMAHEGDVLPRVVPGRWGTTEGFFVLRLVARRPAVERSLADSAEWIRHRIVLERRVAAEQAEVERLRQALRVRTVPATEIVRFDPVPAGAVVAGASTGDQSSSSSSAQQGRGTGLPR
jgi:hypothetical protein